MKREKMTQRLTEKANRFMHERRCSKHIQENDVEIHGNDVSCGIFL